MTTSVPYLIRAMHEWIVDNGCTPYLIVDAQMEDVAVPMEFVNEGQIVLNISATAVRGLVIDGEGVSFSGRFKGVTHQIFSPIPAVLGIIARENGEGMWFPKDEDSPPGGTPPDGTPPDSTPPDSTSPDGSSSGDSDSGKPSLRIVK